jgi:hypothetical protein
MSSLSLLAVRAVASQAVDVHPSHDPWPFFLWAAILVAFLAVVALAAELANRRDGARAGMGAGLGGRGHHRWEDDV